MYMDPTSMEATIHTVYALTFARLNCRGSLVAGPGSTGLACLVIVKLFSTLAYTCSAWGNFVYT